MSRSIADIYSELGLDPVDTFASTRVAHNKIHANRKGGPAEHRGIGATTWMLVNITANLLDGKDVILTAISFPVVERVLSEAVTMFTKLGIAIVKHQNHIEIKASKAALRWAVDSREMDSRVTRQVGSSGVVFNDDDWKDRLKRRTQGPFAMITEIRFVEDESGPQYLAYAEDDEFLLELSPEGAQRLASDRPEVKLMGWAADANVLGRFALAGPLSTTNSSAVTRSGGWSQALPGWKQGRKR